MSGCRMERARWEVGAGGATRPGRGRGEASKWADPGRGGGGSYEAGLGGPRGGKKALRRGAGMIFHQTWSGIEAIKGRVGGAAALGFRLLTPRLAWTLGRKGWWSPAVGGKMTLGGRRDGGHSMSLEVLQPINAQREGPGVPSGDGARAIQTLCVRGSEPLGAGGGVRREAKGEGFGGRVRCALKRAIRVARESLDWSTGSGSKSALLRLFCVKVVS
jgi:hypothetical protein